jgi:antitoxin ParD1/3/4
MQHAAHVDVVRLLHVKHQVRVLAERPHAQKNLRFAYFFFRNGRSGNFLFSPDGWLTTVMTIAKITPMSRTTMSFALPDAMREYIDARVASGQYGNTSEYIRDLIRKDQEAQALQRLRDLIEEGLASGPAEARSSSELDELRAIARGERR